MSPKRRLTTLIFLLHFTINVNSLTFSLLDRSDFLNKISNTFLISTTNIIDDDSAICSKGALVPEQAVPGAYSQVCMTLSERIVPLSSGGDIVIRQEASGSGKTGMAVWNSGLVLTRIIQEISTQNPTWFSNQQIMELGCGTGLVSIVCHRLGAKSVLATDGNPDVVANAKRNLEMNKCDKENAAARILQWGLLNAMDFSESVDLLLGADLTYNSGSWRVLAESMEAVLKPNGACLYLSLGHEGFNVNAEVDGFLSVAEQVGLVQTSKLDGIEIPSVSSVLTPDEKNQLRQSGGVRLVALKRKVLNR